MASKIKEIVDKLSNTHANTGHQEISTDDFIHKDRIISKQDLEVLSRYSIISKKSTIQGDIFSDQNIVILGKFKGNINCKNTVISLEGSFIDGRIETNNIIIYGNYRGNIISKNIVKLFPGSAVKANITGKTFIIEEGAVFDGEFNLY